ncbi:hypothetical protein AB0C52_24935 [Streptomyces sp. NPDC048717]|uniref:hypothetical protein n=1 Tax=Streptomyces sp. NPDC048717 TaxID=3154928 RepID=UPI003447815F
MGKRSLPRGMRRRPSRRALIAAGVLAVLLVLTAAVAWWTGHDKRAGPAPSRPSASASTNTDTAAAPPTDGALPTTPVPGPPSIGDPLAFAKAGAVMLWAFDARTTTHAQQLAGMRAWMTTESAYAGWDSVQAQVPDPVLWSRLADNGQHATATALEAHFPSAFKQALADDPAAITKAYIYAVTVRGKTKLAWNGGGSGAEDRQVTLAVQCRPGTDCRLVAVAPRVAP